jgi:hypothetical protein
MTVMTNGRARKSLSDQIDRLDKVLDGLAEGLDAAIASAVQEAVRSVLQELLAHQEILAKLKADTTATKPAVPPKPTLSARIAGVCGQAWAGVKGLFGVVGRGAATCTATVAQVYTRTVKTANKTAKNVRDRVVGSVLEGLASLWFLRRLATSSTAVFAFGFAVGLSVAFTGVWGMALVGGLGAWHWRRTLPGLFGVR